MYLLSWEHKYKNCKYNYRIWNKIFPKQKPSKFIKESGDWYNKLWLNNFESNPK